MALEAIDPGWGVPSAASSTDLVSIDVQTILATMRRLLPDCAYFLSAWDIAGVGDDHVLLAGDGYPPELQKVMQANYRDTNEWFALMHRNPGRALRWVDMKRDFGYDIAGLYMAEQHMKPAGFHEGSGIYLRAPDGRYVGTLSINWTSEKDATREASEVIEAFGPILAKAADQLSGAYRTLASIDPRANVVLVSDQAKICEVPGYEAGDHLSDGGGLRRLIHRDRGGRLPRRYYWVSRDRVCHRVDVIPCQKRARLIAESEVAWPMGLTHRELEVLSLVTLGYTNPQIGKRLHVSSRTVSTHVEHILMKLNCYSRAEVAATAVRANLQLVDLVGERL